jgi:hypothetical protein
VEWLGLKSGIEESLDWKCEMDAQLKKDSEQMNLFNTNFHFNVVI